MLNTCFPPGSLENFGMSWAVGAYSVFSAPLADKPSHIWAQLNAGEIKCILCDSTMRGFLEASACFLWTHAPFSFADFDLYSFAIINQSYDYNYMLSAVNPPMKSKNNLHSNVQSDG